ncbi:hypothetical protein EV644_10426 [Kribbella orskensis]|uniref:Uncharacterized protein n=1 Tax=Kribbella orskensis TaxID=2512216 RepID=A0ABY2BM71_9ACTN|nr:hypothetical protein EV642_10326 [Kribbella sp. VKM Ac-2500]TCO25522.1 hypothetical protein EV644_10426 [Kribbella orskensis]
MSQSPQGQHNLSAGGNYLLGSVIGQFTRHGCQCVGVGVSAVTGLDSRNHIHDEALVIDLWLGRGNAARFQGVSVQTGSDRAGGGRTVGRIPSIRRPAD